MKKLFLALLLASNYLLSQKTFFNGNNEIITREEFNIWKMTPGQIKVYNDSQTIGKILVNRSEEGNIQTAKINDDLQKLLNTSINKDYPTVVIYYPGKDRCNSSGTATLKEKVSAYKKMEESIKKITPSTVLYLYKNNEGIENMKKIHWQKDPQSLIENTFFNYHYPCSSYVIIYRNNYISHFGEFPTEYLLNDLKNILNQ